MKRKSGHKKVKAKGKKLKETAVNETSPNDVSANVDGDMDLDDLDIAESETGLQAETPASTGTDQLEKLENKSPEVRTETASSSVTDQLDKILNNPDGSLQKPVAVYGRVRLKLKNAKTPESHVTSLGTATKSDAEKGNQHMGMDKQVSVAEKMEDSISANSLPEIEIAAAENLPKKAGNIKIKSSKGLASSYAVRNTNSGAFIEEKLPEEPKLHHQDAQYNKEELEDSLEVIKKVMKMEAAEPFNVPVNPIELGIPDYFDVIDTPMDFGTICSNLEKGSKYMNSEDVYRDVQFIWENCYKYNSKGAYIVELMKRVKKNFAKYWSASGLYSGQPRTNDVESLNVEDGAPSRHDKKPKKGKGFKRHKDGCLCAICIMRRRRQEREAREVREAREARAQDAHAQSTTDSNLAEESKQEENAHVESSLGDDTSSFMETSPDMDAEPEGEDNVDEIRFEAATPQIDAPKEEVNEEMNEEPHDEVGDTSEKSQHGSIVENELNPTSESKLLDVSGDKMRSGAQKQLSLNQDGQTLLYEQKKLELLELEKKRQKSKLFEKFRNLEYPLMLELSCTLFPADPNSLWSGPHSLIRHQKSSCNSDIHKAVASFMNLSKCS
ncbi:hypothetical protein Dimus_018160 [Dionaea muscipula]